MKIVENLSTALKGPLSGLGQLQTTKSSLKTMKNTFYFMFKALFVLRHLQFCSDFLIMKENGLIRKLRFISKYMTSSTGKQTIAMLILLNVLRSKGKQAMKFDQFIEYNVRNIFLKKIIQKML